MPTMEIPVLSNTTTVDEFLIERKPFVLRGSDIGSCSTKWSTGYLADKLGDESVRVHISESRQLDFLNKNFCYKSMSFRQLLKNASKEVQSSGDYFISEDEHYYLRSVGKDGRKDVANIKSQFPGIAEDIEFPSFVPEEKIFSTVFRIASRGISVWTHYDVMDNALIQVSGEKKAVLFPPSDAPNLYLNGDKSEVINIDDPDLDKYPKFKLVQRHECRLLPGDALYIPALWFHNMKYLDFGIAVNVFWKELEPSFYDEKDLYGNKDHLPAQQAFQSVNKALKVLSSLPHDYRQFYITRILNLIEHKSRE